MVIADTICRRLGEGIPDEVLVLPAITYGFSPHHIDGPGTITIRWDTFIESVQQVVSSLAYHGFRKALILNGHGSNEPALDLAARLAIVENPDVHCTMASWWDLKEVQKTVATFRESDWTGHACELETSAYLAIDPQRVRMDLARRDVDAYMSAHFWADLMGQTPDGYANPLKLTEYWSTVSESGTWGDPTVATAEKGQLLLEAAVGELVDIVREFRQRPLRPPSPHQNPQVRARNDRHSGPVPRFTV